MLKVKQQNVPPAVSVFSDGLNTMIVVQFFTFSSGSRMNVYSVMFLSGFILFLFPVFFLSDTYLCLQPWKNCPRLSVLSLSLRP